MSTSTNYSSALDELNSQLTPTQFTYLVTALSAAAGDNGTIDNISCSSEQTPNYTSLSSISPSSLSVGSSVNSIPGLRKEEVVHRSFHGTLVDFQPSLPQRRFSRSRPPLLPISSMETGTGKSSAGFRNKKEKSERSSILALRGGGSEDESMNQIIYHAEMKYDSLQLQVALDGEIMKSKEAPTKRCNELPVCKKLLSKHTRGVGVLSRSSSTETVKAESLPDIDNPMLNIAGRIANEPINPFPILRKVDQMKPKHKTRPPPHFTDRNRIEDGIDKDFRKLQDYKDVSEFFSKNADVNGGAHGRNIERRENHSKSYNLGRRVTNPLYKQYDPTGYHKYEDEMAVECIQMICNEFNSWIKSLVTKKKQPVEVVNSQQNEENNCEQDTIEIGPDFLIQILRTELELPEDESNL